MGDGYIRYMRKGERITVHRLTAEKKIGRKLLPEEQVHHIDGNKVNNHPSNLMVCTAAEHVSIHKGGVPSPKPKGWKPWNTFSASMRRKICTLWASGLNYSQVARRLGISSQTVRRIVLMDLGGAR